VTLLLLRLPLLLPPVICWVSVLLCLSIPASSALRPARGVRSTRKEKPSGDSTACTHSACPYGTLEQLGE
jgi:hypothetical protein